MTPEKKEISTVNKSLAVLSAALGIFASAKAAETEAPAAPVAVTASTSSLASTIVEAVLHHKKFEYKVTSGFEPRFLHGIPEAHKGTDFAAPVGTPLLLPLGNGTVTNVGSNSGFGKFIDISYGLDSDGNEISLRFAHLGSTAKGIKRGISVEKGQLLAFVGMTGKTEGPHTHLAFSVGGVLTDIAMYDASKMPAWTTQPSADMLDVMRTGHGRKATYALTSKGDGPSILAALDPEMASVVRETRQLEKLKGSGDPICVAHDGHKNLSCGGLNAIAMGIAPEVLLTYKEKDFQRAYEHLYIDYGVRRVPSSEKFNYFANAVNFGRVPAEQILAESGGDEARQLKLTKQRYDHIMIKNPDLFYEYRKGWNDDRMQTLWATSGTRHPFSEFELITSLPVEKTLLASSRKKTRKHEPKPIVVAQAPIPEAVPASAIVASAARAAKEILPPMAASSRGPVQPIRAAVAKDRGEQIHLPSSPSTLAAAALAALTLVMSAVGLRRRKLAVAKNKSSAPRNAAPVKVASLAERRTVVAKKPVQVASRVAPPQASAIRSAQVAAVSRPAAPRTTAQKAAPKATSRPVEAIQAAAPKVARIEPRMTMAPESVVAPRSEPVVSLTGKIGGPAEAPAPIRGRATVTMTGNSAQPLRGKISKLADSKATQIDYSDGSRVVTEKDRTTLHNAHPTDDRVLEATIKRVAEMYKGNFKIKIKGDTAVERYDMVRRVKRIAGELGVVDRVTLTGYDDTAGTMSLRAYTAPPQPQEAVRPDERRGTTVIFRDARVA